MAFRDRKSGRDEREKARREERRKALSERLGGRPVQPGRSDAERDESKRRRETASEPVKAEGTTAERPKAPKPPKPVRAEKPKKAPEPAKAEKPAETPSEKPSETPSAKKPARRERTPKRRFWQRGSGQKPKPAAKSRRRPEPERPKAPARPRAERPKAAEPGRGAAEAKDSSKAKGYGKAKDADRSRSRARTRGDRRKPSGSKKDRGSRQDRVKALRGQGASAAKSSGKALREGAAATRRRATAARPKVAAAGRRSWALAAPLLAIPLLVLAFAERGIRRGVQLGGRALSGAIAFLDRHVTPGRAVLLVTIVTAACLIASQFQDYRGVEVGQPGYIDVQGTVSADQVDLQTPRDAHGPLLLILGGLAIALAVAAAATRRRVLGLVISGIGVAGLLVSLIGDRPEGLDASRTAVAYSGTNAVLLDGFYAQVAACGVLIAAGLLVALYAGAPAPSSAKSTGRERRRKPRSRPRRAVTDGAVTEGGA